MSLTFIFTILNIFIPLITAHNALWDQSMYGMCGDSSATDCGGPGAPNEYSSFKTWWWHGYLNYPPAKDAVMELPAGQNKTVELAGNLAFTSLRPTGQDVVYCGGGKAGSVDEGRENDQPYWGSGAQGNLHITGHSDVAGCALAIAYTDNAKNVRPEDFVVFSVQHECVWRRDTLFEVPADLPPCPNGKCMCSWWWIHHSDGGLDQMYGSYFQCNVTYAQGQTVPTTSLAKPIPPVKCEGNPSACVKGPKMPMYWKQQECNNMNEPSHHAPTYGDNYGFYQGAQKGLTTPNPPSSWTCPQSTAVGVFHKLSNPVPLRHRQAKRRTLE